MKAAVMNPADGILRYVAWPDPIITQEEQLHMYMKAAAIKNVDRSMANGKHYSSDGQGQDRIIGSDGVGILADGRRVYAISMEGMVAEQAVVDRAQMVPVPDGLDDITAAALPNAVIGAAMGLRFKADIQAGDTVLINGATGFTGRVAVQIAKHYGAKKVIATGRNPESLQALLNLGADVVVSSQQPDEAFVAEIQAIHNLIPIDVVIDYLWGRSAELLLASLKGKGFFTHRTRFVSVGSVTSDTIQLSASILRGVDLQLSGSGMGSLTKQHIHAFLTVILPDMFQLAAEGKLHIETVSVPLSEIESVYHSPVPDGKRLVIQMDQAG
jgi:NADPH:quinone reductase-like Zn-dependent oxidoreductase